MEIPANKGKNSYKLKISKIGNTLYGVMCVSGEKANSPITVWISFNCCSSNWLLKYFLACLKTNGRHVYIYTLNETL